MIAQALRQIRTYRGAMLVASTGLGKTVVAAHVALQLLEAGEITNVMIIGPKVVRENWRREMRLAGLPYEYFVHQALDKDEPRYDGSLHEFTEIVASIDERWLVIIDESHVYRKRYGPTGAERGAFTRLLPIARDTAAKILLLTGSPYSTDIDNINDQLLLLPPTGPNTALVELDDSCAWRIASPEGFVDLAVGSQLTTPHVARYYGQEDEQGVYIDFDGEKRYIPHVTLHRVDVPLPFVGDLVHLLACRCLEVRDRDPRSRHTIEGLARVAWSSSPAAIADLLQSVLDTPGGPRAYKVTFRTPLAERQRLLQPLLDQVRELVYSADAKLTVLSRLLEELRASGRKAIIFCERLATVVYLERALATLLPDVRCFSTVVQRESGVYAHKPHGQVQDAFAAFAPIANQAKGTARATYDVFISTDAHGVGVNLQDASVVINYDIDWTPIDPVQRAGRVLRPWHEPRTVEIFTFVATVTDATGQSLDAELAPIRQRWERLVDRHGQSQKLIDLPVLPTATKHDIRLADIASQVTIKSGALDLSAVADQDISPYYRHTSNLQLHRAYARTIGDDIMSATTYPGRQPLVYVLLRHRGRYYWPVYDPVSRRLVPKTDVQVLNLIACEETTETAFIDGDVVESLAEACIGMWCAENNAATVEVTRICTLYLKPAGEDDAMGVWLAGQ